jgi:hypothetical protein
VEVAESAINVVEDVGGGTDATDAMAKDGGEGDRW